MIAWGAKFSEHPLLLADRQRNGGQSLLARILVDRCREIAEATKVHRIPHKDHVVIALLIETMQCRESHFTVPCLSHPMTVSSSVRKSEYRKWLAIALLCHPLTDFECPRVSWVLAELRHPQLIRPSGRFSCTHLTLANSISLFVDQPQISYGRHQRPRDPWYHDLCLVDGLSSGRIFRILLSPQTNAVSDHFLFCCFIAPLMLCEHVNYRAQ